jgi:hypothetical protein
MVEFKFYFLAWDLETLLLLFTMERFSRPFSRQDAIGPADFDIQSAVVVISKLLFLCLPQLAILMLLWPIRSSYLKLPCLHCLPCLTFLALYPRLLAVEMRKWRARGECIPRCEFETI